MVHLWIAALGRMDRAPPLLHHAYRLGHMVGGVMLWRNSLRHANDARRESAMGLANRRGRLRSSGYRMEWIISKLLNNETI